MCESDDTDNNMRSMNSTMESFSENAWDNYQVHILDDYTNVIIINLNYLGRDDSLSLPYFSYRDHHIDIVQYIHAYARRL